jgi:UDP-N-acetylmuramoylalanine--D-glutamate ligase
VKRVLIIGFGVSGKACAALLTKRGVPFVVVDKNGPIIDSADFPLDSISQVILSPGIPKSHPIVRRAVELGLEVVGEMEFALRLVENRCIGVTGSNGKTTTCGLIAHVLNRCGIQAKAVGNIGAALSSYLMDPNKEEVLVIELSSFQLEDVKAKKIELGLILNITPNHLDRHASMDEYAEAKMGLIRCLTGPLYISTQVKNEWGHLCPSGALFDTNIELRPEFLDIGIQNVSAAKKVCEYFGVKDADFSAAIQSFKKPLHRMEFLGEKNGRMYYNDSKATSVEAVLHGVSLVKGPVILIAGGVHKGASYEPWIEKFRGKVKQIIAYGQAATNMKEELAPYFLFEKVETLDEAANLAEKNGVEGDFILLSPGCSSYDQFKDYEHRGDAFRKWFKKELM